MKLASDSSNYAADSLRNMFQVFHLCSKYNSMSSIKWYIRILRSSNYVFANLKILLQKHEKWPISIVIPPPIRPGTCSKCSNRVSSTTRWVLSNDVFRLSIAQTEFPEIPEYWSKMPISMVILPPIRPGTCSKCSICVQIQLDELCRMVYSDFR